MQQMQQANVYQPPAPPLPVPVPIPVPVPETKNPYAMPFNPPPVNRVQKPFTVTNDNSLPPAPSTHPIHPNPSRSINSPMQPEIRPVAPIIRADSGWIDDGGRPPRQTPSRWGAHPATQEASAHHIMMNNPFDEPEAKRHRGNDQKRFDSDRRGDKPPFAPIRAQRDDAIRPESPNFRVGQFHQNPRPEGNRFSPRVPSEQPRFNASKPPRFTPPRFDGPRHFLPNDPGLSGPRAPIPDHPPRHIRSDGPRHRFDGPGGHRGPPRFDGPRSRLDQPPMGGPPRGHPPRGFDHDGPRRYDSPRGGHQPRPYRPRFDNRNGPPRSFGGRPPRPRFDHQNNRGGMRGRVRRSYLKIYDH